MKSIFCKCSMKAIAIAVMCFAFGYVDIAKAELPVPSGASFHWGVKATVSGYSGSETLTNFPALVRIREDSPLGFRALYRNTPKEAVRILPMKGGFLI